MSYANKMPRCVACGRLVGDAHAGGCKFARFTLGRAW